MAICTFFGHRECPKDLKPQLRQMLCDLVEHQQVDVFYVGHQGQFDAQVWEVLGQLQTRYPHIRYGVVLAYLAAVSGEDTMFPEDLETVHPRYAIARRNGWMLRQADVVIAHVTHAWGGAASYVERARRQGKNVLFL